MLYEKLILKFLKEKCEGCHSLFYLEKEKREKVITIGYGLSKSKKVSVSNFLCANSEDIFGRIKDTLKSDPDNLIVYAGTKNIDTLRFVRKKCEKTRSFTKYEGPIFKYFLSEGQMQYR